MARLGRASSVLTHADARGGIKRYGPPQSSADMMSEDAKFALGF